jgi:hypothetical protein
MKLSDIKNSPRIIFEFVTEKPFKGELFATIDENSMMHVDSGTITKIYNSYDNEEIKVIAS